MATQDLRKVLGRRTVVASATISLFIVPVAVAVLNTGCATAGELQHADTKPADTGPTFDAATLDVSVRDGSPTDARTDAADAANDTRVDSGSGCRPDVYEPNNFQDQATGIGEVDEDQGEPLIFDGSFHELNDEDFYQVEISDGSDAFGTKNPSLYAIVSNVSPSVPVEVSVSFSCRRGSARHTCEEFSPQDESRSDFTCKANDGSLSARLDPQCHRSPFPVEENGTAWIRVKPRQPLTMCGVTYRLSFTAAHR